MRIPVAEVWVENGYVCITDALFYHFGRVIRGDTFLYRPRRFGPAVKLSAKGAARLIESIGDSVEWGTWIDEDSHLEWLGR